MMENHLLNEKIPQSHNIRGCYQKKNSRQVQLQVFSSLISGIAAVLITTSIVINAIGRLKSEKKSDLKDQSSSKDK